MCDEDQGRRFVGDELESCDHNARMAMGSNFTKGAPDNEIPRKYRS